MIHYFVKFVKYFFYFCLRNHTIFTKSNQIKVFCFSSAFNPDFKQNGSPKIGEPFLCNYLLSR